MYCDKHNQYFNEMDYTYRSMRTLKDTDELISKIKDNVHKNVIVKRVKITCYTVSSFI